MPSPDPLGEVADELYGLNPEDFTAARNARAKAAQAAGDRDLAEAVRGLAKPTAAAWLANQLVRHDPESLGPLLELGVDLRQATAALDGGEMRRLSREQPKVVAALVKQATALAKEAGKAVSAGTAHDLESTLRAAVADEDAADQLMAGRLANSLQHNGFGLVAPGNLSLVRTAPEPSKGKQPATAGRLKGEERKAAQLVEAEQEVDDAQAAVEVTVAGQEQAQARVDDAEGVVVEARSAVDHLREQLEQAKFAVSRAEGELREAKQGLDRATRAARAAANGLADATAKRDKLKS
ncbi:MAG: hypothetical protein ACJ71T_04605 [Actinomycetales bacterium]